MLLGNPQPHTDFNPKIRPWDVHLDSQESLHVSGAASASDFSGGGSAPGGGKIRPVKFMAAKGNFSGNTQAGGSNYGSVNGSTNGVSAPSPGASAAAPMPSPSAGSNHSAGANAAAPKDVSDDAGICDL